MSTASNQKTGRPQGMALVIVLIAITLMALSAYVFSNRMLDHRRAAETGSMRAQSDASIASAVDATRAFLMQPEVVRQQQGGVYNNPAFFSFQPVFNDPQPEFRSQFSILSTDVGDTNQSLVTRYGLVDESSKLNLNDLVGDEDEEEPVNTTLALLVLPGMTVEIADAILDWIDENEDVRQYGAEAAEEYAGAEPPRTPSNGPIHSLSELLLVRGVTPELLYGMDQNRNGQVEAAEAEMGAALEGLTGQTEDSSITASMELGWSAYLTVYSRERNVDPQGNYRLNINSEDMEVLYEQLVTLGQGVGLSAPEDVATFICAMRIYGPEEVEEEEEEGEAAEQQGPPGNEEEEEEEEEEEVIEPEPVGGRLIDLTQEPDFDFDSVADLFELGYAEFEDEEEETILISPFAAGEAFALLRYITTTDDRAIHGRINVNQASRPILASIRELPTEAIQQIIEVRPEINAQEFGRAHPMWLFTNGIVDLATMREIMPRLTAGGDVYSADIVASTGDGNAVKRVRVILDATRPEVPQLVWKDKGFLGRGFPREMLVDPESGVNGAAGTSPTTAP